MELTIDGFRQRIDDLSEEFFDATGLDLAKRDAFVEALFEFLVAMPDEEGSLSRGQLESARSLYWSRLLAVPSEQSNDWMEQLVAALEDSRSINSDSLKAKMDEAMERLRRAGMI